MKIIRKRANEKKLKDKNKTTITTKGKNETLTIKITNIKEKLGKTVFYSFQYKNGCLAASDLFHKFAESIKFYTFHYTY